MIFSHRSMLLCGVAVALLLSPLAVGPAWADGGTGGSGNGGTPGGAGGPTSTSNFLAGLPGADSGDEGGGGGGGGGGSLSSGTGGFGGNGGSGDIGGHGTSQGGESVTGGMVGSDTQTGNSGTLTGGAGGPGNPGVVGLTIGGTLIVGGGGGGGGGGGFGLLLTGIGSASNATGGAITGGVGGGGGSGDDAAGNTGGGGGGGGAGGGGILLTGNSVFSNAGQLKGGAGGIGGRTVAASGGNGGDGGMGVALTGGGSIDNTGAITGGAGGNGGAVILDADLGQVGGNGGAGGDGLLLSGGGSVTNNGGTVIGGNGGTGGTSGGGNGTDGVGGVGIVGTGNDTVITSGAIAGGLSGGGTTRADAIDFSGGGNTLVLEQGYKFTGNVVSTSSDTLALGGATGGMFNLSQVGGSGEFQGFANFEKIGSGTWVVDNAASFMNTTVEAGTLEVGDAADPDTVLTSNVSVENGGTLRGHGTIDGNVVNNGVVFPGGSIGILTVNGNFTQTSGGTLTIEVAPGTVAGTDFDQLRVTGSASLAGTLAVQVDNGTDSVGSLDDILHASGGVSGNFSTITTTTFSPALAAFITPVVSISGDDVTLELTPSSLAFSTGRIYAASNFAQNGALFNVLSTPLGGPGTAGADTDQGYWLHGLGAFGQANGFDFNEEGFVIGKGFTVSPNLTLGGGISNVYTVTSGGASAVNGTSVGAQVYGLYTAGPATISASVMAGHLGTNISRGLPTLGETAQATSTGAYEAAALHLQYNLLSGSRFFVAPYVSASYLHTGLGGATETGAGILDMHYDAMSTSLAELGAGVSGGLSMPVQYGTLTAWAGLGGEGTLGNPNVSNTEVLGSFSAGESALAAPVGAFTPAVGMELTGHGPWRLAAAWGGQFGSATSAENFSLEGRYVW